MLATLVSVVKPEKKQWWLKVLPLLNNPTGLFGPR